MTGTGVTLGKAESGESMSLNHVIAASEGGRDRDGGRGLQLDEAGAGWGPGVGLTPWYRVLAPYTLIGRLG
jgi:hypothetical protein